MALFLAGIAATFALSMCIFLFLAWRAPLIEDPDILYGVERASTRRGRLPLKKARNFRRTAVPAERSFKQQRYGMMAH